MSDQTPSLSYEEAQDVNAKTVKLVELIGEIGPDVGEISRRLGQFKESVRYRYREKIVGNGFSIQAIPNYGALGLRRIVMKVRVAEKYSQFAQKLFSAMSDLCFVVGYAGTMLEDSYILHAGVPVEFVRQFQDFIGELQGMGTFESVEFHDCGIFRVAKMRADCFDFDEGVWDFDWSNPPPVDVGAAKAPVCDRAEFDQTDLLLVKELWKDGTRPLTEIQEAIKTTNGVDINYKTLGWHYSNHVLGRRLITGYAVGWHKLKYDRVLNKNKLRPHGYLVSALLVKGVSTQERSILMEKLNRLPFLWSEAAGKDYYSQFAFPIDASNEALDYVRQALRPLGERAECHILNQKEMQSFSIGYKLWDTQRDSWKFNQQGALTQLDGLLPKLLETEISRN